MPTWIRNGMITLLLLGTVSGWGMAIFLGVQLLPQARAADERLEGKVSNFISIYVEVQAAASGYEQLGHLVTGPVEDAITVEAAAGGEPVEGLRLLSADSTLLWRHADQALVEGIFTIEVNGAQRRIGEHYLLRFVTSSWLIEQRWRIEIDPGTPLVEGGDPVSPAPAASPAPSG